MALLSKIWWLWLCVIISKYFSIQFNCSIFLFLS
jgi:hypothetical protein